MLPVVGWNETQNKIFVLFTASARHEIKLK